MTLKDKKVDILLSTFNGACYLSEQIESILGQTHTNWHLIIRDDGSTDGTRLIIESYVQNYPEKISHLGNASKNEGPCLSFGRLLRYSDADYIMFSDQDDIWLDDKIEISLAELIKIENREGEDYPVLVHSDLTVVDSTLNIISDSFMSAQILDPGRDQLNQLIVQNIVTGCTTIINKALKDKIGEIDVNARMHDWWIALAASAFGTIRYIDNPTVLYRQHQGNAIGVRRGYMQRLLRFKSIQSEIKDTILQSKAFFERYATELNEDQSRLLNDYSQLTEMAFFDKRRILLRHGLGKYGLMRTMGFYLLV